MEVAEALGRHFGGDTAAAMKVSRSAPRNEYEDTINDHVVELV